MVKLLTLYAVGAEKDHIVPWDAAWRVQQLVAGKKRYVLASNGHIAGIINPPGGKGSYWTNDDDAVTLGRWPLSVQGAATAWLIERIYCLLHLSRGHRPKKTPLLGE